MTRSRLWIILLCVAVAGFMLGRFSGSLPLGRTGSLGADVPLFPAPPHDLPAAIDASDDIVVELPVDGAASPAQFIDVAGRARIAGGPIAVTVKDAVGSVLAAAEVGVEGLETEEYGRFAATLSFAAPASGDGTVEFSRLSSGAPVVRRVRFAGVAEEPDEVTLKIYFHNGELGPADDCSLVFPVERHVAIPDGGLSHAFAAVLELLSGPTAEEKAAGYTTALPDGAEVISVLRDEDDTVTADFAASLERGVAGSCRVFAIRSQIETTLRQFPETRAVTISVEGRIDDALQP